MIQEKGAKVRVIEESVVLLIKFLGVGADCCIFHYLPCTCFSLTKSFGTFKAFVHVSFI